MEESNSHGNAIPEQLNYQFKNLAGCHYKMSRIVPLSGGQVVDLPISSTAEVLFEIPTNVFNFAESYLYGNVAIPAQGANNFIWYHADGMPLISEVDLYTRSGVYLCQLPNFQNYMKIVRKIFTPFTEYESNDETTFMSMNRGNYSMVPGITGNNGNSSNLGEAAYVYSSGYYGCAANAQLDFTFNIPLKTIKKTIFALDKDLVFGDILVLRILFGPAQKFTFSSLDDGDPNAYTPALLATAPVAVAPVGPAPTYGTSATRIYNLCLFLAVEKNEDLAQSCRALVNSEQGLNILIEYPYSYKQSLTGTSQNLSLRFNRGHGKNLLAIITSPFNPTESLNSAYDCSNVYNPMEADSIVFGNAAVLSSKVVSYYTQLDNTRLVDIQINGGLYYQDDYRENRKHLKDTAYFNAYVYNQNYFHMDKFYEDDQHTKTSQNLDKGLSLIVERKWDYLATVSSVPNPDSGYVPSTTGINWYTFAICQKDLHIGRNSIQFQ